MISAGLFVFWPRDVPRPPTHHHDRQPTLSHPPPAPLGGKSSPLEQPWNLVVPRHRSSAGSHFRPLPLQLEDHGPRRGPAEAGPDPLPSRTAHHAPIPALGVLPERSWSHPGRASAASGDVNPWPAQRRPPAGSGKCTPARGTKRAVSSDPADSGLNLSRTPMPSQIPISPIIFHHPTYSNSLSK